ncbi:MAG: tetratricopeptide repeat protein [Coxiellaceae bacterium]|nr:tetratricopeptide repeat protein [Coxiellaceae bacterium]
MRPDMTNREEQEFLKNWWDSYGKAIVIAVVVGLAIGYGWRYYHKFELKRSAQASVIYQQLLVADKQGQPQPERRKLLDQLVKQFPKSSYTSLAQFLSASDDVSNKQYKLAEQSYRWVMQQGNNKSLQQVARLRLAKILTYQKQFDEALKVLNKVNDKSYLPMIENVRGDIYAAKGSKDDARKAYQQSEQGLSKLGVDNPLLKLKIASL